MQKCFKSCLHPWEALPHQIGDRGGVGVGRGEVGGGNRRSRGRVCKINFKIMNKKYLMALRKKIAKLCPFPGIVCDTLHEPPADSNA